MPELGIKRFRILFDDTEVSDPVNWKSFVPTIQAHPVYKTLISQFGEKNLILIKDAKNYADQAYDQDGVTAIVEVKWQEYNSTSNDYDSTYSLGRLSFRPGKYKRFKNKTEVGFEPDSFIMNLLNRDEIEMDLQDLTDLDGSAITTFTDETLDLTIESQLIKEIKLFEYIQTVVDDTTLDNSDYVSGDTIYITLKVNNDNGGNLKIATNASLAEGYSINQLPGFIVKFLEDGDVNIAINASISILLENYSGGSGAPKASICYKKNTSSEVILSTVTFPGYGTFDQLDLDYDSNFDLAAISTGDRLRVYVKVYDLVKTTLPDITVQYLNPFIGSPFYPTLKIIQETEHPDTTCRLMPPWEYLLRICQKITGRNDCLRSSYFGRTDSEVHTYGSDGEGSLRFISNVYQLRQYPISFSIKSGLMKAFLELNEIEPLAIGVVYESDLPYISIEKESYWKSNDDSGLILYTDEDGINWSPSDRHIIGSVKSGFKNFEEKETGTQETTHTPRVFTIDGVDKVTSREYNIQSDIIGSGHLIELLRRKPYDQSATKDEDFNRKRIILDCKREGGGFTLKRDEAFSAITNLKNSDTNINLEITPVQNLIRHAPILLSGLAQKKAVTPATNKLLRFQSGEANILVTTQKTSESVISEGGDLNIDMLPTGYDEPLFNASYLGSAKVKLTKDQRQLIKSGFTGYITVIDDQDSYQCYLESVKEEDLEESVALIEILRKS